MGRKQKEGSLVRKSLSLNEYQNKLIKYHTFKNNWKSESDFIGWLIETYDSNSDPIKELSMLNKQKSELKERMEELEDQEKKVIKRLEHHKIKEGLKKEKIQESIEILKRKLMEGEEMQEIERLAKNRAILLNVDAYELIFRAGKEINR